MNKKKLLLLHCILPLYITAASPAAPGQRIWNIAAENLILFNTIESKACELADQDFSTDLSNIFTAIEPIENKTVHNDSIIDNISSIVDDINQDFIGTQTMLESILSKVCLIEEDMQFASINLVSASDTEGQPISSADVGGSGLTINTAGKYILCEDIATMAASAITIDTDNVELDMNGYAIRDATTAITINGGLSNIAIYGGFVVNTTGTGIVVLNGASNLHFEDIWVDNAGREGSTESNGYFFDSCSNFIVTECHATYCTGNGIRILGSNRFSVLDGMFNLNGRLNEFNEGIDSGISIRGSNRFTVRNCDAHENEEHGCHIRQCQSFIIERCFCTFNTGDPVPTPGTAGIRLRAINDGLIRENVCIQNMGTGIRIAQGGTNRNQFIANICIENARTGIITDDTNSLYLGNILLNNIGDPPNAGNFQETDNGPNSILGNWAGTSFSTNYGSTSSDINEVTATQAGSFSPANPTKWQNISMTLT